MTGARQTTAVIINLCKTNKSSLVLDWRLLVKQEKKHLYFADYRACHWKFGSFYFYSHRISFTTNHSKCWMPQKKARFKVLPCTIYMEGVRKKTIHHWNGAKCFSPWCCQLPSLYSVCNRHLKQESAALAERYWWATSKYLEENLSHTTLSTTNPKQLLWDLGPCDDGD